MCWRVIPEAARDHWWMKRWWSGGSVWQLSHPRSGLTRRHILQCSRGKVPPQDWAPAAHTGNRLDNTHFISSIPSLSHFPTPLQAFPGIISQINYLWWNPHLSVCFWGIRTKTRGYQLGGDRAFNGSLKFFLLWQLNFYLTLAEFGFPHEQALRKSLGCRQVTWEVSQEVQVREGSRDTRKVKKANTQCVCEWVAVGNWEYNPRPPRKGCIEHTLELCTEGQKAGCWFTNPPPEGVCPVNRQCTPWRSQDTLRQRHQKLSVCPKTTCQGPPGNKPCLP